MSNFALENPTVVAIPFFLLSMAIEFVAIVVDRKRELTANGKQWKGFQRADSISSVSMGLGSFLSTAILKFVGLILFSAIWTYLAPWHITMSGQSVGAVVAAWVGLFVALDLCYYFSHRCVHRVRLGWAAHQAHHSSEFFNLTTALRQKWNPWHEWLFFAPLAFFGFPPFAIFSVLAMNLVYQFIIHTEVIGKLWAPIEFIFNTPSHHRVHHGSDAEYLDKNYAGTFIIWDRMFGTFVAEKQRPIYGLTKPVTTNNVFRLQYFEYANIWRDMKSAPRLIDKIKYLVMPPGWSHIN